MRQWGLSMDELMELALVYLTGMARKYPELARLGDAGTALTLIASGLIHDNNQRIAEQLNQHLGSQSLVEVLPPIDADVQVAISGVGVKLTSTGTIKIFGEARNVAGYDLSEVEIIAALYDEQDRVVDRGTDTVYDLAVDGKYVFEVIILNAAPFVHYEVTTVVTE